MPISVGMTIEPPRSSPERPIARRSRPSRIAPLDGLDARPAGLGRRVVAGLIDAAILSIGLPIFAYIAVLQVAIIAMLILGVSGASVDGLSIFLLAVISTVLLFGVLPIVYGSVSAASSRQATPGKMIMELAVVRASTGEALSPGRAVLRAVSFWLPVYGALIVLSSAAVLGAILAVLLSVAIMLGVAISRDDRRSIHDLVADSSVIADPRRVPAQMSADEPAPR